MVLFAGLWMCTMHKMNTLRHYRELLHLSQYELSAITKIPRYRLQLLDSSLYEPTNKEFKKISAVLEMHRDNLVETLNSIQFK
jgi:cytoskeletal protein RodZ